MSVSSFQLGIQGRNLPLSSGKFGGTGHRRHVYSVTAERDDGPPVRRQALAAGALFRDGSLLGPSWIWLEPPFGLARRSKTSGHSIDPLLVLLVEQADHGDTEIVVRFKVDEKLGQIVGVSRS
jgi:hypothetical protein